jgi:hypothetical protein
LFVSERSIRFTEEQARAAIAASLSWAESLRRLDMCASGGNWRTLQKYAQLWQIPTDHFDPYAANRGPRPGKTPLADVLVENSTYNRASLKRRLFEEGLKERRCELCGQDENWQGRVMGLILDHINGARDDHRLENLRIVCPNCAATLDTHCGRKNRMVIERDCLLCGETFVVKYAAHRYCSPACGQRSPGPRGIPTPGRRKVERPPYEQLVRELAETNFSAVGRKYGVSDNAVRKWLRWYERQYERGRKLAEDAGDEQPPLAA